MVRGDCVGWWTDGRLPCVRHRRRRRSSPRSSSRASSRPSTAASSSRWATSPPTTTTRARTLAASPSSRSRACLARRRWGLEAGGEVRVRVGGGGEGEGVERVSRPQLGHAVRRAAPALQVPARPRHLLARVRDRILRHDASPAGTHRTSLSLSAPFRLEDAPSPSRFAVGRRPYFLSKMMVELPQSFLISLVTCAARRAVSRAGKLHDTPSISAPVGPRTLRPNVAPRTSHHARAGCSSRTS